MLQIVAACVLLVSVPLLVHFWCGASAVASAAVTFPYVVAAYANVRVVIRGGRLNWTGPLLGSFFTPLAGLLAARIVGEATIDPATAKPLPMLQVFVMGVAFAGVIVGQYITLTKPPTKPDAS